MQQAIIMIKHVTNRKHKNIKYSYFYIKHINSTWKTTFAGETQVNSGIEHVTLLMSLHVAARQEQRKTLEI